jgi:hypothetical protein
MMARSIALHSGTQLRVTSSSSSSSSRWSLPDLQALSTAPFVQQVQYGMELTDLLHTNEAGNDKELKESLMAQLSHSDGIRGFMVAYLSGSSDDVNDDSIPLILLEALQDQFRSQENADSLVSLLCMNVVMPTAMITMHQDAEQSANSARTARKGRTVLKAVMEESPGFVENLRAIQTVAHRVHNGDDTQQLGDEEDALVMKWTEFFAKWGYERQQARDIEEAMNQLLA